MKKSSASISIDGNILKIDYGPYRVRQASGPFVSPTRRGYFVGKRLSRTAHAVDVVKILEPKILRPRVLGGLT